MMQGMPAALSFPIGIGAMRQQVFQALFIVPVNFPDQHYCQVFLAELTGFHQ